MALLRRKGVMTLTQVNAEAERAPLATKIAGTVLKRQERKSARGDRFAYVQISDPTGLNEVTVFSDALKDSDDHLKPGRNVVMNVTAAMDSGQLRLRVRSASPIETVTAVAEELGLRIFVENSDAVSSVATLLERTAQDTGSRIYGEVQLRLMSRDLLGEVDVSIGDRFRINPQIKSALKSVSGVVQVEEI